MLNQTFHPRSRAAHAIFFAVLLSVCSVAHASTAAKRFVTLHGHLPAALSNAVVSGRAPLGERVDLALTLPLHNQAGLTDLLRRLYDPKDPQYGKYLSSDEFARRFSPTEDEYNAAIAFAQSAGLTVTNTYANRLVLDAAGPSSAVESAFHLKLLRYETPGGLAFRGPSAEPSVPVEMAGVISGVLGLDTSTTWHTHSVTLNDLSADPRSGTGPGGGLSPSDIKAAYNLSSVPLTGAGQTLGLFELDGYTASDIGAYETHYGLPNVPLNNVTVDGFSGAPSGTGGTAEVTLDIELQIAVAPGATKIIVYEGPNTITGVVDTYNRIATDNQAKEVSTSWGLPELWMGNAARNAESAIFQQMAAQGQSIFAAAGDSGAHDDGSTLSVDDPASQPYMTGVGGTRLATVGAGGAWASESTWSSGGGGISQSWTQPTYQNGAAKTGTQASTTMRNVPDVSLDSDPGTGYSYFCGGGFGVVGGTSCAAPLWSAFAALANQKRLTTSGGTLLGFVNPALYQIGKGAHYAQDFHDIADNSSNGFYHAATGYDCATGWGTFNGAGLLADLAGATTVSTPPVPKGLKATAGPLQAALTWTPSTGATSYNVYAGTTAGGESSTPIATGITTAVGVTAATYVNTGLTGATTYYYKVTAVNSVGESAASTEASVTLAPAAPTGIGATVSNGQVVVSWTASAGATTYNVYSGTATGVEAAVAVGKAVSGTSFTHTTVLAGKMYFYKVTAVNAGGESARSAEATTTLLPAVPLNLHATGGNGQAALTWMLSSGATSYSVYVGSTAGHESGTAALAGVVGSHATVTGLANGSAYYFTVTAVNAAGETAASTEASATLVPATPTSLAASPGSGQVALSWNASAGAVTYNVYCGSTTNGEKAVAVATGLTGTTFTNTALPMGKPYFYKVSAVNATGESPKSTEAGTLLIPAAPAAPHGTPGNGQVALSWTASPGATTYNVYAGTSAGGESQTALATGVVGVKYTNTGLTNGNVYYYTITAVNAAGESTASTEVVAALIPGTPTGLQAVGSGTQVALTWSASAGAVTYNVYVGTTAGGEKAPAVATGLTGTSFTDTGLAPGKTYYFKVTATNATGESLKSNEASAILIPATPINVTAVGSSGKITVAWAASSGSTSYRVYAGMTPGGESDTPLATGVTTVNYANTGLTNGNVYYYRVTAVNAAGESAPSSEVVGRLVPAAPSELQVTAIGNTASLSWTAATGAVTYNVYMGTTVGGEKALALATGVSGTSTTVTAGYGLTYYFKVTAVNATGESIRSNETSVMTIPGAPANVTVTAGTGKITVAWTASPGATSYNIYAGSTAGGESQTPLASHVTGVKFINTGTVAGLPHFYVVSANNAAGESALSAEATTPSTP